MHTCGFNFSTLELCLREICKLYQLKSRFKADPDASLHESRRITRNLYRAPSA